MLNRASEKEDMDYSSFFGDVDFSGSHVGNDDFSGNDEIPNDNYTVSSSIFAPVFSAVIVTETLLAFLANAFVILLTLCNWRCLKQPSTIFLLSLSVSNLVMATLFMPFTAAAAVAGEWMIGTSPTAKNMICHAVAFSFSHSVSTSVHTLSAISFDRWLFIVFPLKHRQFMKPWVALLLVLGIWFVAILFNIPPFFGMGEHSFGPSVASCVPIWVGHTGYVIYFSLESTIPLGIIILTAIWTFVFTGKFFKEDYQRRKEGTAQQNMMHQRDVYNRRVRNLFGIFGTLLFVNVIAFFPYITISIVGFAIGFDNVPDAVYATVFAMFLFSNVANPLVQSYFRKDLWDAVLHCKNYIVSGTCCRKRGTNASTTQNSTSTRITLNTAAPLQTNSVNSIAIELEGCTGDNPAHAAVAESRT